MTLWPGASPEEVEQEIVQRQEEELKSVDGLVEMTSESFLSLTIDLRQWLAGHIEGRGLYPPPDGCSGDKGRGRPPLLGVGPLCSWRLSSAARPRQQAAPCRSDQNGTLSSTREARA